MRLLKKKVSLIGVGLLLGPLLVLPAAGGGPDFGSAAVSAGHMSVTPSFSAAGIWGVRNGYCLLNLMLLQALKEQQEQIGQLTKEIETLKATNAELQRRLEAREQIAKELRQKREIRGRHGGGLFPCLLFFP